MWYQYVCFEHSLKLEPQGGGEQHRSLLWPRDPSNRLWDPVTLVLRQVIHIPSIFGLSLPKVEFWTAWVTWAGTKRVENVSELPETVLDRSGPTLARSSGVAYKKDPLGYFVRCLLAVFCFFFTRI